MKTYPLAVFNRRANERRTYGNSQVWRDRANGQTIMEIYQYDRVIRLSFFDTNARIEGIGADVRSAYREACRQQRLARHDTADLLRNLAIAERKIAADAALLEELRNALGYELQRALGSLNRIIAEEISQLRARNAKLERENEELRRSAAGERLSDDLMGIVTALTAKRDNLRDDSEWL